MTKHIRRHFLPVLALGALLSCAPACSALREPLTAPDAGGPPWRELATPRIVLRTDLDEDDAREAIQKLDALYLAIAESGFPPEPKPTFPTQVILFENEADYRAVAPRETGGYFFRPSAFDGFLSPTAVLWGIPTESTLRVFAHEQTHSFVRFYYPQAPAGLSEGLAMLFETILLEDSEAVVGSPHPYLRFRQGASWDQQPIRTGFITYVPVESVRSPRDLLVRLDDKFRHEETTNNDERQKDARRVTGLYASAWGLAHFLTFGPPDYVRRFDIYLDALARAEGSPAEAYGKAFGDLDEARFQADFRGALTPREWGLMRVKLSSPTGSTASERELSSGEVHQVFASLSLGTDRGLREADAAVKADPNSVEALIWRARMRVAREELTFAEQDLERAVELRPSDVAANFALILVRLKLKKLSEIPVSLVDTLSRSRSANVLAMLSTIIGAQDNDRSLLLARRAIEADPSSWFTYSAYAKASKRAGNTNEALRASLIAESLQSNEYE